MKLIHIAELIALGFGLTIYILLLEKWYWHKVRKDREQWELGDSCLWHEEKQYRKSFGIADVRTLRRDKF